MVDIIRKGGRGDAVKATQEKLVKLGFDLKPDGIFGDATDGAVRQLQTLFGYDIDGIVGPATASLMDAQIGYGWNLKAPDAKARALAAQGKAPPAGQQQAKVPTAPVAAPTKEQLAAKPSVQAKQPVAKG